MTAKKTTKTTKRATTIEPSKRPRILVLEAAGGSATNAVMRSGAKPIRVNPRDLNALDEALARRFDGLLLTGGGDLDPRLYGQRPHKQVYGVSETRDYGDWTALERAHELGLPVMGICRGMQMIAVQNGGKLKQHIEGHRGTNHPVTPEDRSAFGVIVDKRAPSFPSLHHQIVVRHGAGMRVAARSAEGYIEAIESLDRRVIAVQFHPEYDYGTNEASRRLFDWLAQAAAEKAGLPMPKRIRPMASKPKPSAAPLPRKRQAGDPTRPRLPKANTVTLRWCCRECGMRFDRQQDRQDHEDFICFAPPEPTTTEPPFGRLDWIVS